MLLCSCREDFVSTAEEESLFAVSLTSELVSDQEVSASLLRTLSFTQKNDEAVLQHAHMMFGGTNLNKGLISMDYNPDRKEYIIDDPEVKIKEGNTYNIIIESEDADVAPVKASTYIPHAVKAREIRKVEVSTVDVGAGQKKHIIELSIVLNEPIEFPAYYRLVPYRILSQSTQTGQGTKITDFRKRIKLDVLEIVANRSAVTEFVQKEGVYADQSRLDDNEVHLILETPEPLASNEVLRLLEVDIYTLTEELYQYNDNLDKQIKNSQADFSSHTEVFTNVENGYGVFGGASKNTLLINL